MFEVLQLEQKMITKKLDYVSDLVDQLNGNVDVFTQKIKQLKQRNRYLYTKNKILEAKLVAVQQKVHQIEQNQLVDHMDMFDMMFDGQEELSFISNDVTAKLLVVDKALKTVQHLNERPKRAATDEDGQQATEQPRPKRSSASGAGGCVCCGPVAAPLPPTQPPLLPQASELGPDVSFLLLLPPPPPPPLASQPADCDEGYPDAN